MNEASGSSTGDGRDVFVYTGCGAVPVHVTRARVHPSVATICDAAFASREGLIEVDLDPCDGLERIGQGAFRFCKSLERISIPPTVKVIGPQAFRWCEGLAEVVLSEGLEEIGEYAFDQCKSLERIVIPSTVRRIGEGAFSGCTGLLEVVLSEGLEEIGGSAFWFCKSLERIVIPSTVRRIGGEAFIGCSGMFSVEMPGDLQEIPRNAFLHCKHLRNIAIPPAAEDKWGGLPILYALWGSAPREVVQLLAEGHKSSFPNRVVDWGRMIVALGKGDASDGIRTLLDVQRSLFPDQCVAWQECAMELASSSDTSVETFRLVLRLSVADRLDALGVEK